MPLFFYTASRYMLWKKMYNMHITLHTFIQPQTLCIYFIPLLLWLLFLQYCDFGDFIYDIYSISVIFDDSSKLLRKHEYWTLKLCWQQCKSMKSILISIHMQPEYPQAFVFLDKLIDMLYLHADFLEYYLFNSPW